MSLVVGAPGLVIMLLSREDNYFIESGEVPYTAQLSIGNFQGLNKESLKEYTWIISICNCVSIIGMLIFSVVIRTMINRMNIDLDKGSLTPSDYCCIVSNLPVNKTQAEIKERFEKHFKQYNIEVAYVNYAYNIEDMVRYTNQLKDLLKKKGIYKVKRKQFGKKNDIPHKELKENPKLFTHPPTVRDGICGSLTLELDWLDTEISAVE